MIAGIPDFLLAEFSSLHVSVTLVCSWKLILKSLKSVSKTSQGAAGQGKKKRVATLS
jgi:hypothetical protein